MKKLLYVCLVGIVLIGFVGCEEVATVASPTTKVNSNGVTVSATVDSVTTKFLDNGDLNITWNRVEPDANTSPIILKLEKSGITQTIVSSNTLYGTINITCSVETRTGLSVSYICAEDSNISYSYIILQNGNIYNFQEIYKSIIDVNQTITPVINPINATLTLP
ncbi:MAG: hypothetical protein NTW78_00020 [Campylobacterales bacterium]|nr:hypothetical protein [Campylobacterales bacterium]